MEDRKNKIIDLLAGLLERQKLPGSGQDDRQVRQELDEIKEALIRQFLCMEDKDGQKLFIRNLYTLLVNLSDRLFESEKQDIKEQAGEVPELLADQTSILFMLDDLMNFIRENFSSCFSEQQKIPEQYRLILTREIMDKLEKVSLPATGTEYALLEKIKGSVRDRLGESGDGITYGLVTYLQSFTGSIDRMYGYREAHAFPVSLTDMLISYNFNAVPVMHDLICTIRKEVDETGSDKEKIHLLNHWMKRVSQVPVRPGCAFDKDNESVSEVAGKWLKAEILFHEKTFCYFQAPVTR